MNPVLALDRRSAAEEASYQAPVRLKTVSAFDLVAEELGDIEWQLPGFIPAGGFVVLYGAPKSGKTTLMMHMAAALAGAQEFDGKMPNLPFRVLWLDLEQSRRTTQRRLREVRAHASMADFNVHQGAPPELPELLAAVDFLKPEIVFVDSLSRWLRLESENDNAEVIRTLGPILTAFQERDVSLVTIHHDRKSEGEGGRNLRGASTLLAMVDVAIEVRVEGDASSTLRRLSLVSRHDGQRQVLMRLTEEGFVSEGTPTEKREQTILAALAGGPQKLDQLAQSLALTPKAIKPQLDALAQRGLIVRTGDGKRGDPHSFALARTLGLSGNAGNPGNPNDSRTSSPSLGEGRVPESEPIAQVVV